MLTPPKAQPLPANTTRLYLSDRDIWVCVKCYRRLMGMMEIKA